MKYTVRESGETEKLLTERSSWSEITRGVPGFSSQDRAARREALKTFLLCASSTTSNARPSGVNRGCDQLSTPVVIWRGSPPETSTTNSCESVNA